MNSDELAERIKREAAASMGEAEAERWYNEQHLQSTGGKTPAEAVETGEEKHVLWTVQNFPKKNEEGS